MIKINGLSLAEDSTFPGGELHIKLPELNNPATIVVNTRIKSSDTLVKLLLVKDALDFYYPGTRKILRCLYLPYARQDRRCNPGEAFSAAVIAKLIDNMGFDKIVIADVHSIVARNFILKTRVRHLDLIDIFASVAQPLIPNAVFVAPDAGSYSKVSELADQYMRPLVTATKRRIGSRIYSSVSVSQSIEGRDLLIVDDICDGGGTFIALAKELKELKPASISLYVTHGIFSKGLDVLHEAGISKIFTTDSYCDLPESDSLKIIDLTYAAKPYIIES